MADTFQNINLRTSFAKNMNLMPAFSNMHFLTDEQKSLWKTLYGETKNPTPLNLTEIEPILESEYMPNVWMFEVAYDEEGKVKELNTIIQGSKLDEIYGTAHDDRLVLKDYEEDMAMGSADEDVRTIYLALAMVETKIPLFGLVKQLEGSLSHFSEHNLVFPVCHNSDRVNIVFGHTEVLPAITDPTITDPTING